MLSAKPKEPFYTEKEYQFLCEMKKIMDMGLPEPVERGAINARIHDIFTEAESSAFAAKFKKVIDDYTKWKDDVTALKNKAEKSFL